MAGLWLAGWGAARLAATVLPEAGLAGQFVAATIAIWNPYVAERLLQGHWSLLVGYGCLPWVAAAMLRLRDTGTGVGRRWRAGVLDRAGRADADRADAGRDGRGGMRARAGRGPAAVAVRVRWRWAPRWWRRCHGCRPRSSRGRCRPHRPKGSRAFAARAEPGLGTLGSLAGLGGIWNADAVPASRTTLFAVVAAVVLLGIVAVGLPVAIRRPAAVPLLFLAAVAVVVPAAMATGPGLAVARGDDSRRCPASACCATAQKWVALAVPGYALAGAAAVVDAAAPDFRPRRRR